MNRRKFLFGAAIVAGGGLVVAYWPGPNPLSRNLKAGQHPLNAYVKIDADGIVTVAVPRAEMGQGVQTALAALVADELDVPWESIRVGHPLPSRHYVNLKLV